MKKILPILVMGVLVLGGLGASALYVNKENMINNEPGQNELSNQATHTVFGEEGTATWCGYCKYAHGAMKELYAEGQLDFYYVTLVDDKNPKAATRCRTDYNIYGFPTVWWDGGYKVDVGASSVAQAKATYTASINYCGTRVVKDLDATVEVIWLGGTEMQIDVSVKNNEESSYTGKLKVYITEKVSSMGWIDSGGVTYTFPFLDWAFNQDISIPDGDTWEDSMTWDGASNGFPTITSSNIMIIAAVFNSQPYQGYSYPPSQNPFTAYYLDECVAAEPYQNQPPEEPTISGPTSGDPGVNMDFTFTTIDNDQEDIYYWIEWGDGTNTGWIGPYTSGTPAVKGHIFANTAIYNITAKAKDINDYESGWSKPYKVLVGNFAPEKPVITGPINGGIKTEIEYTFVATDPNGDNLYYNIKWGDGTTEDWIGPYSSGQEVKKSHSWKKEGTWYIQASVKDTDGLESGLTTLKVTIPKTRHPFNSLFSHFFEQFPVIYKLLENLLEY